MIDSDEAATPQTRYKRNRPTTTTKALNFRHALDCLVSRRNLMDFADCVCQHRAFYRQKKIMPFLSPLLHCLFSSLLMSVMSFFSSALHKHNTLVSLSPLFAVSIYYDYSWCAWHCSTTLESWRALGRYTFMYILIVWTTTAICTVNSFGTCTTTGQKRYENGQVGKCKGNDTTLSSPLPAQHRAMC